MGMGVVDNRIKKRIIISAAIGALGQIAMLLYLTETYATFNWHFFIGSLGINVRI